MKKKNQPIETDIAAVLKKYPDLKVVNLYGKVLEGTIDIEDESGNFWGKYQIRLVLTEKFPHEFPKMYEIGGKIPKNLDWHTYSDGSCCTTIRTNELLVAKNGITILKFLNEFGVPYLANHKHKELCGEYASGEYSHGLPGFLEFYQEKLNSKQLEVIVMALDILLENKTIDRNSICFCGSEKKFKRCHAASIHELSSLPKKEVSWFHLILAKEIFKSNFQQLLPLRNL
jgi:SEC-C motif